MEWFSLVFLSSNPTGWITICHICIWICCAYGFFCHFKSNFFFCNFNNVKCSYSTWIRLLSCVYEFFNKMCKKAVKKTILIFKKGFVFTTFILCVVRKFIRFSCFAYLSVKTGWLQVRWILKLSWVCRKIKGRHFCGFT